MGGNAGKTKHSRDDAAIPKEGKEKSNDDKKNHKNETISNLQLKEILSISSRSSRGYKDLPPALSKLDYELHQKIGSGGFSEVYEATNRNLPGIKLACKVFQLNTLSQHWTQTFLKIEMKIMTKLNHKNICRAYDVFKTHNMAYIFMQFAQNGTMDSWIQSHHGRRIKEKLCKKLSYGLMSGLDYLHQHNIAHRDLKLENFLLDENLEPMITDFGFSVLSDSKDEAPIIRKTTCGSVLYVAPEVRMLNNKEYDAKKADIYSMGICFYEMLHGFKPFEGDYDIDSKELTIRQQNCDYRISNSLGLSAACRNIIEIMLLPRPIKRPTAQMVLKHAWFTSLQEKKEGTKVEKV